MVTKKQEKPVIFTIPEQYRTQSVEIESDGLNHVTTSKLSDPLLLAGQECDPLYREIFHRITRYEGLAVSYEVLGSDRMTVLRSHDCSKLL